MTRSTLSDVTPDTLPLLETALARLSADLGDRHHVDTATLHAALFGPVPACYAVLALDADAALRGAALYSPVMSTTMGSAGAYVSDLWVTEAARGQALGQHLLAHVAHRAHALWQARFVRLVSYAANTRARAFYARLGFAENHDEVVLQLSGDALDQLKG